MAGEKLELVCDVLVEQAMRADADGEEQKRVEKLIDRNE